MGKSPWYAAPPRRWSLVLTRDMHRARVRRGGAIVAIALALLLLAFVFQNCGNPMSGIDGLF